MEAKMGVYCKVCGILFHVPYTCETVACDDCRKIKQHQWNELGKCDLCGAWRCRLWPNESKSICKGEAREQAEIKELKTLIEKAWKEYQDLQDQYRKLTGREHEWLK